MFVTLRANHVWISGSTIERAEIESFHAKQTQRLAPVKMNGGHFVSAGNGNLNVDQLPVGFVLRPATSTVSIHHQPGQQEDLSQNPSRSYSNLPFSFQVKHLETEVNRYHGCGDSFVGMA